MVTQNKYYVGHIDLYGLKTVKIPETTLNFICVTVIYKIIDPHNYLLITIDGQLMRELFEHERLKPAVVKTDKGNVTTLPTLKKAMNLEITPPASK